MKKKIYQKPIAEVFVMNSNAVMAATSWYDGHGGWHKTEEGNPDEGEDPDPYSKANSDFEPVSVWNQWDE